MHKEQQSSIEAAALLTCVRVCQSPSLLETLLVYDGCSFGMLSACMTLTQRLKPATRPGPCSSARSQQLMEGSFSGMGGILEC